MTINKIRLRLRGIAAGILCFVALGKDATGRLKQKTRRFRSSCANAHFASLRPLGIHEAEFGLCSGGRSSMGCSPHSIRKTVS